MSTHEYNERNIKNDENIIEAINDLKQNISVWFDEPKYDTGIKDVAIK